MHIHFHRALACLPGLLLCASAMASTAQETISESSMNTNSVRITWYFDAPPERVWAVWTEPEAVRQWFGSDPNGKVLIADLAVRVGGGFQVTFADADGTQHTASGRYQQVEPYNLLTFSWSWKSEPGIETLISVAMAQDGNGTKMHFEHGGLFQASSHDYEYGWRSTFQKFEKVLLQ